MSSGIVFLFVISLITYTTAYWIDAAAYDLPDSMGPEYNGLGAVNAVSKRRLSVCMQWGMTCVPESSFKFTKCCDGLNCVCNLWKSRCSCRAKLI